MRSFLGLLRFQLTVIVSQRKIAIPMRQAIEFIPRKLGIEMSKILNSNLSQTKKSEDEPS